PSCSRRKAKPAGSDARRSCSTRGRAILPSGSIARSGGNWRASSLATPVARTAPSIRPPSTIEPSTPPEERIRMATTNGHGIKQVGYFDCAGGGQVVVDGDVAFVAHMHAPHGTTIADVSDPSRPRELARVEVPNGMHSHNVRAANGLMAVNREAHPSDHPAPGFQGGLGIFDVSNPDKPREITFWRCGGSGVHRFTFDGRYAYISPEVDGYVGNIVMILDLDDPGRPREAGRWWM